MTNSRVIRLRQQGYRLMALFKNKERANARAALHREQGHAAAVVPVMSKHDEIYHVYIKDEEA